MGLLGTWLAKLLGRSPGAEAGREGGSAGDAQDAHAERLSRIAQRGRGDSVARPTHGATSFDDVSPMDLVPPPGAGEAPAFRDEPEPLPEAETFQAPEPGPEAAGEPYAEPQADFAPDETPEPYAAPEPEPYELAEPHAETQPDFLAGGEAGEPPVPFAEADDAAGELPSGDGMPMGAAEEEYREEEPEAFAEPVTEEQPADLPGEPPFAAGQEPFDEQPGDPAEAFEEPVTGGPPAELPEETSFAAGEEPLGEQPDYSAEKDEDLTAPSAEPFAADDTAAHAPATDWAQEEPEEAAPPPGFMPPDGIGDEPLAAPADFMPEPPEQPEGFALATKSGGGRRSSLGLSPMSPDDEVEAAIEPGDRTAIVFRQIFPPPHDGRLSFFGGAPIASPAFVWPRPEGGGAPFSFLMQIDCAAVPDHARMGMPGSGILYVFMDLTWGQQDAYRIVHEDAARGALIEIAPPDDLPPAFGAEARHIWEWPRRDEDVPRLLPKWPFEPAAIDIPSDAWEGADEESLYLWPGGGLLNALLLSAQGDDVPSDYFTVKDFIAEDGSLIRPFPLFPHDARSIQIVTGLLLKHLERKAVSMRAKELEALSDEERAALFERIRHEAQEWYDDAAVEPPFDGVPEEAAEQFWAWLAGFPWLARFVMTEAMKLSIEASLTASAEAAARVPPEVARRVRSRHALAVSTETGLHVNIPDRMLAPPVDVQGNQAERAQTHILLLEISSNEGLGHHFGEGVCQFWITPEDLKAGRFDKVELTADAY